MGRILRIEVLVVACVFACLQPAWAATRGITVGLRASESPDAPVTETVQLYDSSHALVIGMDNYTNGWPKLSNAVRDAEMIAAELEKKGFDVELHKNLTSNELNTVFKRFFILKGDDPQARLFIWYAGHGATIDGEGYLVPADAPVPTGAGSAEFKYASVALRDFGTFMRQAVSKHVYAVFDSCFAGTVFASQRALPPAAITRATTMPVRQFLTSGDADQTVSDDGTFRELFIRAIEGEERADANGDGYLTGSELGMFLGDRVTNLTQSLQTPRYGKLRDKNFDRGDFVFELPEGAVANKLQAPSATSGSNSAEIAFWNSIKDSDSAGQFDAYLKQYPQGTFAALAMVRKNEIARRLDEARKKAEANRDFTVDFIDQDMLASKVANVRETPFPTATRVGQLEEGAHVWAVGETRTSGGTWYKVARDGIELGFVYGPLLEPVTTTAQLVAVEPLPFPSAQTMVAQATDKKAVTASAAKEPTTPDQRLSFLVEDLLQEVGTLGANKSATASDAAMPVNTVASAATRGLPPVVTGQPVTTPRESLAVAEPGPTSLPSATIDEPKVVMTESAQSAQTASAPSLPMAAMSSDDEPAAPADAAAGLQESGPSVKVEKPMQRPADDAVSRKVAEITATAASLTGKRADDIEAQPGPVSPDAPETAATAQMDEQQDAGAAAPVEAMAGTQLAMVTEPPAVSEARQAAAPTPPTEELSDFVKRYIAAAKKGNTKAQMSLGYMYETGEHVSVDKKEAVRWYTMAADGGEVDAMVSLGVLFESGKGLPKDLTEAAIWYRKAAVAGNADAQQTVAYMYENGSGVVKDVAEAARWYEKAAMQGRVAAQNNLGRLYQLGIGVDKDIDKAIFWYERAAKQGSEAATNNLKQLLPSGS